MANFLILPNVLESELNIEIPDFVEDIISFINTNKGNKMSVPRYMGTSGGASVPSATSARPSTPKRTRVAPAPIDTGESLPYQIFRSEIRDKNVVLVIGADGCGKSALLHSLLTDTPGNLFRDPNDGTIDSKEVLMYQGLPRF